MPSRGRQLWKGRLQSNRNLPLNCSTQVQTLSGFWPGVQSQAAQEQTVPAGRSHSQVCGFVSQGCFVGQLLATTVSVSFSVASTPSSQAGDARSSASRSSTVMSAGAVNSPSRSGPVSSEPADRPPQDGPRTRATPITRHQLMYEFMISAPPWFPIIRHRAPGIRPGPMYSRHPDMPGVRPGRDPGPPELRSCSPRIPDRCRCRRSGRHRGCS